MRQPARPGAINLTALLYGLGGVLRILILGSLAVQGFQQVPSPPDWPVPGGDPRRGKAAIERHSCGSCHGIPGITAATGRVGPRLNGLREQAYLAGRLPNVPPNLIRWIMDAQAVDPGNAMPDLPVTETEARDMAAYLYTMD